MNKTMTEQELLETIKDYHKAHHQMWMEWAQNPDLKRRDLQMWDSVIGSEKHEKFFYKGQQINNGCFLCRLSVMGAGILDCSFCIQKISTFYILCNGINSLYRHFIHAPVSIQDKAAIAARTAHSIRPIEEIFENLKHLCKPQKWEPREGQFEFNGATSTLPFIGDDTDIGRLYGIAFPPQAKVEEISKQILKVVRMWAYKEEFDPDFVPDWTDGSQEKYFPKFNWYPGEKIWGINSIKLVDFRHGLPYFSKEACKELVRKLDLGEVEF